jgi:hypothetical protein
MRITRPLLSALIVAFAATGTAFSADGILFKQQLAPGSNYCHMKFPAIREDSLNWGQPVLKDSNSGDIVDFYGSCNESPGGRDQVNVQKSTHQARHNMNYDG